MIVQGGPVEIPEAIFTKDGRIRPKLAFVERRGRGHDLERGTRFHHVDDGAVFHLFGLRFGSKV